MEKKTQTSKWVTRTILRRKEREGNRGGGEKAGEEKEGVSPVDRKGQLGWS